MTGAAVMAAGSALRSGTGLVKVFSDEKTLDAVRFNEPCALLELRPEKTADLLRRASMLCRNSSSVLVGPGIPADYKDMGALTERFIKEAKNVVIDAGALSGRCDVWSGLGESLRAREVPAVLTPHIGEFARMTGLAKNEIEERAGELASEFAVDHNCVVVLKSSRTFIAPPDGKVYVNSLANSGLAKGGSGDVLAGLVTGFLAQGMEPFKAACSAVFIHSKAGEAAKDDIGVRAMIPTDLIFCLDEGYRQAGWSEDDE
jgi:NAD(P)H-hydrate epimerase